MNRRCFNCGLESKILILVNGKLLLCDHCLTVLFPEISAELETYLSEARVRARN